MREAFNIQQTLFKLGQDLQHAFRLMPRPHPPGYVAGLLVGTPYKPDRQCFKQELTSFRFVVMGGRIP
jgi:hypothetical protein